MKIPCFSWNRGRDLAAGALMWAGGIWCGHAAEALQVGMDNLGEFPGGKEADAIAGDFLLRSDVVEAVISQDSPNRRANMSTFYGADGITPGCLYDLTLKGTDNDQITIFCPLGQRGEVSHVRIAEAGGDGAAAAVETFVSAAEGGGLERRHEYRLEDGLRGVLIVSTVTNRSAEPRTVSLADKWTSLSDVGWGQGATWGDAIDPADGAGYAFGRVPVDGERSPGGEVELAPGESVKSATFLAVGRSPADAAAAVVERLGERAAVRGTVAGPDGEPVIGARVEVAIGERPLVDYTDAQGGFEFLVEPGDYTVKASASGRPGGETAVSIAANGGAEAEPVELVLGPRSAVMLRVTGPSGRPMPCKAQFIGIDGTPSPNLGPANRAHGCRDQFHSESGQIEVALPAGSYRVVATRGPEFTHFAQDVTLGEGETVELSPQLERVVETPGWVSVDFHNHSTPSGDNYCGTPDRIINLAAEHIEFAPATEHNRIVSWAPTIDQLGLSHEVATVTGMELTGSGAHLNSFPLEPKPGLQDNGAPVWQSDPRLNAIVLRSWQGGDPDRWVHVNHPDMVENFVDRDGDGMIDGGFAHLPSFIDALETQNYLGVDILAGAPFELGDPLGGGSRIEFIREFIWLQVLNQGHRIFGIAVADAHSVHGNGVGGWRTYVASSSDDPAGIDWREIVRNAKAGRSFLTTGPFLEVAAGDGSGPGADVSATESKHVDLKVRVQCTDWVDIDRVQVLVNGRQREDLNFTRAENADGFREKGSGAVQFERAIPIDLEEDSHLIVVAVGENSDLSTAFGSSPQANMQPCAYNNPIFVDVDGGGFTASGDTLGFDLPVKGMTPDQVRALLGEPPAAPPAEPEIQ